MMPAPIDQAAMRVTMQYWKGNVRICELECSGRSLDIRVKQAEEECWVFEAHSDRSADPVIIAGSGATRSAALLELASSWSSQAAALGLYRFDWDAVAAVLRSVNVIETARQDGAGTASSTSKP
jgi:hypothetical protein